MPQKQVEAFAQLCVPLFLSFRRKRNPLLLMVAWIPAGCLRGACRAGMTTKGVLQSSRNGLSCVNIFLRLSINTQSLSIYRLNMNIASDINVL
jgi:hypothetical protein